MNLCFQGLSKVPINCMENIVDPLIGRQQLREYVLLQLTQIIGHCHVQQDVVYFCLWLPM